MKGNIYLTILLLMGFISNNSLYSVNRCNELIYNVYRELVSSPSFVFHASDIEWKRVKEEIKFLLKDEYFLNSIKESSPILFRGIFLPEEKDRKTIRDYILEYFLKGHDNIYASGVPNFGAYAAGALGEGFYANRYFTGVVHFSTNLQTAVGYAKRTGKNKGKKALLLYL